MTDLPVNERPAGAAIPSGTVTLLFTDIEGSTKLWQQYPDAMPGALARHLLHRLGDLGRRVLLVVLGEHLVGDERSVPQAAVSQTLKEERNLWSIPSLVLAAGLSPTLEGYGSNWGLNELVYLQAMYDAGARDFFDILSANPFGFADPPAAPASPETLNFSRVLLLREVMVRNGDTNKAVWFNEYGWNAAPADFSADRLIWQRVTEEQQARYTMQGLRLAQDQWEWAGVFCYWYFRQVGDIPPEAPEYYFRMVDVDFTPRPVYLALKETSPAVRVAGPWLAQGPNSKWLVSSAAGCYAACSRCPGPG